MTPADLAEFVRARLAEFLSDGHADPLAVCSVVAQFGCLPLMMDMGGCYALRPDGEVVTYAWDPPHDLKVEHDARIRNMALFQGSRRYSELSCLVPERPESAVTCPQCQGTGEFVLRQDGR